MKIILKNIYDDILELSDIEKQKRYWLGKDPKHISSYEEVMSRLYDDSDFENFITNTAKMEGLSDQTIVELKRLSKLLNEYKEKESAELILEDKEWGEIVNQAKIVIADWNLE